ncbi:MAG TPA: hypothetical protein VFQ58_00490 [Flavisolibacter sp.]|nr:hypothetical protein [Flavisolibacter sp.]
MVIDIPSNPSRVVVTDGYHITKPLDLIYSYTHTYYFKVVCAIEDDQLIVGFIIIVLLFAMGATSGIFFLQILSLLPLFYFLFLYYINRKEFIQIRPA